MDDYEDYLDMGLFEILLKHFENVQEDLHSLSPGFFGRDFKRSHLRSPFRVALDGIEYICNLLQDLKRLQSDATFSDVTIKVDGKVFHGHRCVLAAASRYFETMFSSGFKEGKANEVELKEMDGTIFEMIFNFMYSGQINLFEDTALPALHVAAYLGVRNAERIFIDYFTRALEDNLMSSVDTLPVWDAAERHGMHELSATIFTHILRYFDYIVKTDVFLEKAPSKLIDEYLILENISSDEQLLSRIVQWLKHDWENRKGDACKLLQSFRLGLLPKDKVQELIDDQILEIPECKEMMDDLMEKWAELEGIEDPLKLPESFLPRGMRRTLIAFGGQRDVLDDRDEFDEYDSDESIDKKYQEKELFGHYFDKKKKEWTLLRHLEMPGKVWGLKYPSVVAVNRDLYLAGGCRYKKNNSYNLYDSKQLFKLDGNTYKWTELPPMKYARSRFALVHHDGFLYAIGGICYRHASEGRASLTQYYNGVERFNLSTQKWDHIYALPVPMAYTSAAIVEGKILVYGKLKDHVGEEEKFWLVGFDPLTQKWVKIQQERYRDAAPHSILVVHDGACYRVKYEVQDATGASCLMSPMIRIPRVNHIEMKPVRSGMTGFGACIGHEVEGQNTLPENYVGAFHIDGHIYINNNRFAHKTGAVQGDPNSEVEDQIGWSNFKVMGKKCVVEYAFDSKKMW
ncbi:kelch-like protein 30 [Amphiura filiformis]|uniref:kelch-like protein 30 n=1 Tax=Amphiura filiformis TaxID=82378 RepID=UPI003B215F5E